jgi:hypothetical protein
MATVALHMLIAARGEGLESFEGATLREVTAHHNARAALDDARGISARTVARMATLVRGRA